MSEWHVERWSEENAQAWDDFVWSQKNGHTEQTWAYVQFQTHVKGRELVGGWCAKNERGEIGALCWVLRFYTGTQNIWWGYSPRGPVGENVEAMKVLIEAIHKTLEEETELLFWRLDPGVSEKMYKKLGLGSARVETKSFQPTDSLWIDLEPDEEAILASMKRKGRYNIKVANKAGVEVREAWGEAVKPTMMGELYKLIEETAVRDGFAGHGRGFYEALVREMNAGVFVAYSTEGVPIAGAILTVCGPEAVYAYGGSSGEAKWRPMMAPYAVQWAMMRAAKARGARRYNLTGVSPEGAEKHRFDGITQFKTRFGGTRLTYAPGREIVLRRGLYWVYRIGKRVMGWVRR